MCAYWAEIFNRAKIKHKFFILFFCCKFGKEGRSHTTKNFYCDSVYHSSNFNPRWGGKLNMKFEEIKHHLMMYGWFLSISIMISMIMTIFIIKPYNYYTSGYFITHLPEYPYGTGIPIPYVMQSVDLSIFIFWTLIFTIILFGTGLLIITIVKHIYDNRKTQDVSWTIYFINGLNNF